MAPEKAKKSVYNLARYRTIPNYHFKKNTVYQLLSLSRLKIRIVVMVPAVLWKNRLFLKLHPWSPKITLLIAVICVYVKCAPKNILIAIHQLCQCTHMRSNCYFEEKKLWLLRPAVIICTSYQLIQID